MFTDKQGLGRRQINPFGGIECSSHACSELTAASGNMAHLCLCRVGQDSERERSSGAGAHGVAVAERVVGRDATEHVRVTDVASEEVDALQHKSWVRNCAGKSDVYGSQLTLQFPG